MHTKQQKLETSEVTAIILAAGKGSRMNSDKPKVMHAIGGKSMIQHVLEKAAVVSAEQIVVIGHQANKVKNHIAKELEYSRVHFALQQQQLGTGHAVKIALEQLSSTQIRSDKVLILYGDVPLITTETLSKMLPLGERHPIVILSAKVADPTGYGRIVRDETGAVVQIIEQKDANELQQQIQEINSGIMLVQRQRLEQWLEQIDNHNSQEEYYLTDIVDCCVQQGGSVTALCLSNASEINGINTQLQRVQQERAYQQQRITQLVDQGLGVADFNRLDIRGQLRIGRDVFFDINVVVSGDVGIGHNVVVGPGCVLRNCVIGDDCTIKPYSNLEDCIVGKGCVIGPYARIRPETVLGNQVSIGNFVETKKSTINDGSKVNHLSYVGDSQIGAQVNVGAGTITCNYDGKNKHRTDIGDNAFIGSGTQLVAPVSVGSGAVVGAGSVVDKDVDKGDLYFNRAKPITRKDWAKNRRS